MNPTRSPETVFYGRMSTNKQDKSLEEQRHICITNYNNSPDMPVWGAEFVDPGVSGKTPFQGRPAAREMIRYLRRGDCVVVAAFDRLGRDIVDLLTSMRVLRSMGVRVKVLDLTWLNDMDPDNPMTEGMLAQFAAFAQWERQVIGRRVRQAIAALRAAGHHTGHCRQGEIKVPDPDRPGKFLVEKDPVFQEKLEYIYDLHWKEGYGSVIIQRKLGERGEYWSRKRIEKALAGERKRRRGLQDRLLGRSSSSPEVH